MRRMGKRQRASRKKHRRFKVWTGGGVSGDFARLGPFGKSHGQRYHRWMVREHLANVKNVLRGEPTPKTRSTTVGPGSGTAQPHL